MIVSHEVFSLWFVSRSDCYYWPGHGRSCLMFFQSSVIRVTAHLSAAGAVSPSTNHVWNRNLLTHVSNVTEISVFIDRNKKVFQSNAKRPLFSQLRGDCCLVRSKWTSLNMSEGPSMCAGSWVGACMVRAQVSRFKQFHVWSPHVYTQEL